MSVLPESSGAPSNQRPLLALTLGDPAGIGPEIALAALDHPEVRAAARVLALGPADLRPPSIPEFPGLAATQAEFASASASIDRAWHGTESHGTWTLGNPQEASGRAALAALSAGHALASSGRVDALVTGPVSKEALHLAGEPVEGQTQLLARWSRVDRYEMLVLVDNLRVMLLTRHLPLREALERITTERVAGHLELLNETLQSLGIERPRIALAGLNPHAGEAGILGSEEIELLLPAVQASRRGGLDVSGPISPDTVFLQAKEGRYDGVLALYHDQAFIPLKLISGGRGLTLIAGLPYLRVSPVHGTAFDIAGRGVASAENLVHALVQAAAWSRARPGDPLVDF